MTVGVVGGSGFIGTRLVSLLIERSIRVVIVDKNESAMYPELFKRADVRSRNELRKALRGCDAIINLAAEHRDDVTPAQLYHDVNVKGSEVVCSIAQELDIRTIVFTSTVAIYGFAPRGTDESGMPNPFNDYGRSKLAAEAVYSTWQKERDDRTVVIVRPTVVFGEDNRGNVYNLLRQIASRRFLMVGAGTNIKSLAYVENVAAFIVHCHRFPPGLHIRNYIDKPDLDMNTLVSVVRQTMNRPARFEFRIPYWVGYAVGGILDVVAAATGATFPVSAIRVRKFCSDSLFESAVPEHTDFVPPISLRDGIARTISYEFGSDS